MVNEWCYVMCDNVIIPLLGVAAFVWSAYQEWRHRKESQVIGCLRGKEGG